MKNEDKKLLLPNQSCLEKTPETLWSSLRLKNVTRKTADPVETESHARLETFKESFQDTTNVLKATRNPLEQTEVEKRGVLEPKDRRNRTKT